MCALMVHIFQYIMLQCGRRYDCRKRVDCSCNSSFATWNPEELIGAYIFGGVTILQMNLQALGIRIPGQFFNMAPYVATIIVLIFISSNKLRIKLSAPASLTIPFFKGK